MKSSARHETLRTRFAAHNGKPAQIILAPRPFELGLTDLSESAERESEVQRLLVEEARRPFDLSSGFLLRIHLFRLGRRTTS